MKVNSTSRLFLLTAALLCAVLSFTVVGIGYARIEYGKQDEVQMSAVAQQTQLFLESETDGPEGLLPLYGAKARTIPFALTNVGSDGQCCAYDQMAHLQLFVTQGADPEFLDITLEDGGLSYTAQAEPVLRDSTLYLRYGPGWILRFYNSEGEELSWLMKGNIPTKVALTLNVEATEETPQPALLQIILSGSPGQE